MNNSSLESEANVLSSIYSYNELIKWVVCSDPVGCATGDMSTSLVSGFDMPIFRSRRRMNVVPSCHQ